MDYQEHLNHFADTYRLWVALNPDKAKLILDVWKERDKKMHEWDIEKKAKYADYVSKRFCKLDKKYIIAEVKDALIELDNGVKYNKNNSCTVCNLALRVVTLKKHGETELAERLAKYIP